MPFGFARTRALPTRPRQQFNLVDQGFNCSEDDGFLTNYLPMATIPQEDYIEFLGVFGRVVEIGHSVKCYQYMFVWDGQKVLPHPMDYEPVFIFVFEGNPKKAVLFDAYHYKVGRYWTNKDQAITLHIHPLWHSFRTSRRQQMPSDYTVQALTDDHLNHWWELDDPRARLLIHEEMVNPMSLLASYSFRSRNAPISDRIMAWVRLPFLAYVDITRSLGEALSTLFREVVGPARARFSNPTGKKIVLGYLTLASTLEEYGLVEVSPTLKSIFKAYYEAKVDHRPAEILRREANLIDKWVLDSAKPTEDGEKYFLDLKEALKRSRRVLAHSKRWLKHFKAQS